MGRRMRGVMKGSVLIEAPRGGKEQMAAATATASVKRMLIDGKWVDADNGRTIGVINPATEDVINEVAYGGRAETRRALEAPGRALPARMKVTSSGPAQGVQQT